MELELKFNGRVKHLFDAVLINNKKLNDYIDEINQDKFVGLSALVLNKLKAIGEVKSVFTIDEVCSILYEYLEDKEKNFSLNEIIGVAIVIGTYIARMTEQIYYMSHMLLMENENKPKKAIKMLYNSINKIYPNDTEINKIKIILCVLIFCGVLIDINESDSMLNIRLQGILN